VHWSCFGLQGQILFISNLEETVRDVEFVFEVVPEDLKIKQQLFKSTTHIEPMFIILVILAMIRMSSCIYCIAYCVSFTDYYSMELAILKKMIFFSSYKYRVTSFVH